MSHPGPDLERLERVARRAGQVAHDLNNVLTVLLSASEAVRRAVAQGEVPAKDDVEQLVSAGARARALNEQLLEAARERVAPADGPRASSSAPRARGGSETILLVEDDAAVRRQVLRALAGAGYQVHVAADGREASSRAAELAPIPDLLITDVSMPYVGGVQLAEALRARWPRLRVLFVSGAADDGLGLDGRQAQYLAKPFSAAGLLARVRQVLDAG